MKYCETTNCQACLLARVPAPPEKVESRSVYSLPENSVSIGPEKGYFIPILSKSGRSAQRVPGSDVSSWNI
jgi:hypothetical protein